VTRSIIIIYTYNVWVERVTLRKKEEERKRKKERKKEKENCYL
jgi:hypothetical protein